MKKEVLRGLISTALALGIPASALATTPVPVLMSPTAANGTPLGQGIVVQSIPDEWGGASAITFNYKGAFPGLGNGLISETGDPPGAALLSPWVAEATASDIQGNFTGFIEYTGPGGSELYAKLLANTTVLNPSGQSSVYEDFPAVYAVANVASSRHLVWQQGAFTNWEIKYMGPVSPTGTVRSFGRGQRPAISQSIVAWEDLAGDISYTLNRGTSISTIGTTDQELLPAVGGNRIFYEKLNATTGTSQIAFRETNNLGVEYTISGPCAQQFKPRVSGDGHNLLYTGTGCPAGDGTQPLYLVNIDASRTMTHYLVADLGRTSLLHDVVAPYDIDADGIAYQYYDGTSYTAYWALLDMTQLP